MSPDNSFLNKIDPQLQEKLAYAPENEILRVIVRLSGENQSNINANSISPADFPNRAEYRKALIAQRQQQLSGDIGTTKKAIENLALKTYGGKNTKTLVVEGTVNQVLQSLELSGIESATLDRGFTPISPSHNYSLSNSLESIFLEIAEKANIISTTRINRLAKFLESSDFNVEKNTKQLIIQASQRYIANYRARYGLLKVLGMSKPINLESIYTNVKLQKESKSRLKSIEELENLYHKNNVQFRDIDPNIRRDIDVANHEQYLIVLGSPGSGKSIFMRRIGLEVLKGKNEQYQHECIPVLLELKIFIDTKIDIKKLITQEFKACGIPAADKFVAKALEQGRLLILLDGLDEVLAKNLNSVYRNIQDFVDHHYKNRYIVSCRIAAYQQIFRRFTEFVIAEFDDQQIKQFINSWFKSEANRQMNNAHDFWQLLQKSKDKNTKELAQNPLLLTFLCLVYDRSHYFPFNRSVLYRKALIILLEEWSAEKRIQQNSIYQGLHTDLEEILLAEIAYSNFIKGKIFFRKKEIIKQIEDFLALNLYEEQMINGEVILNAIIVQQGILVERAYNVYSFSHLAFQEYLAAQYIVDNDLVENIVSNNLIDIRWEEIFQLVAGLMSNADTLLLLMEKEAQKLIINNNLRNLLCWADRVVNRSNDEYKLAVKRAWAIYLAIVRNKSLDLAISSNYDLDPGRDPNLINKVNTIQSALNLLENIIYDISSAYEVLHYHSSTWLPNDIDRDVARAISRINCFKALKIFREDIELRSLTENLKRLQSRVPNKSLSYERYKNFSNEISQLWINTFKLDKNWINLRSKEMQSLSNYIEIQLLILKCKEAAVRVSPETWKGIESRMLLPTENTIN